MSDEKRLAVLIDSDNVSAKYAQFIMQEADKYGRPTYKRVYGDWEKGGNGWHSPAINYSIMPVQQTSYIAGKNATDFSMIIDAMDILYSGKVDGFVLVTSDSDFTRLAIRLREAGMLVVGIGELKTPRAFTASCNHFCYLNQVCAPDEGEADEAAIRKAVLDYVTENKDERLDLARISAVLTSRFGNIDFEALGYKRFAAFIDSFRELRRSNTFVSLKKKPPEKPAPAPAKGAPSEQEIVSAIGEYFEQNAPVRDNMMKLESFLTAKFGIIDYSRFGSKRFARFIDKLDGYTRNGTDIAPAAKPDPVKQAVKPEAKPEVKEEAKPEVKADVPAEPEKPHEPASLVGAMELVLAYAGENMPDGGNLGQLNNELMARFGKGYLADLGCEDIKSLLAQFKDVRVRRNHVFLTDAKYAEYVENALKAAQTPTQAVTAEEKTEAKPAEPIEQVMANENPEKTAEADTEEKTAPTAEKKRRRRGRKQAEAPTAETAEPSVQEKPEELPEIEGQPDNAEETAPKPVAEINAIKRDVLLFAATDEDGTLAKLGTIFTEKYGKGWLKAVGFSTVKKLLSSMKAVAVNEGKVSISEEFAAQTEQIEQFVNEYARSEGSRSIRALSTQLKKRFEGFDISEFGFARFSDFVNAIDGVKAERYHVVPDGE